MLHDTDILPAFGPEIVVTPVTWSGVVPGIPFADGVNIPEDGPPLLQYPFTAAN